MRPPGAHLDDDELLDVLEHRGEDDTRRELEAHAAGCAACRKILSALARQLETSPTATTALDRPARAATEPAAGRAVPLGDHVGRYVITRVLGEGGMGIVYAATDPELDRTVAVKVLGAGALDERLRLEMEERLRREARAMAKLSHPNVVAVHDVGTHDGRVFIAMEYVEGETLAAWLEAPRPLASILEMFRAAGRGLAAAHAQ